MDAMDIKTKRETSDDWRVALVRHPRPRVAPGTCYGRTDLDLHPDAAAQIEAAVHLLRSFAPAHIWSSPARRCAAMAAALSHALHAPIHTDARLLELDFGAWEGQAWDDIPRDALDLWAADPLAFAPPGGESGANLVARITEFHQHIESRGTPCIVVAHAGPLKLLGPLLRHSPLDLLAPSMPIGAVEIVNMAPPPSSG